jgi:hypothetical protein
MNVSVEIGRKGSRQLGPKDSPHTTSGVTRVREGDVVTFTIPGGKEPALRFTSASPFSGTVTYNVPLRVAAKQGRFRYECSAHIDGLPLGSDDDSGGEVEIIRE